ncbi:ATP-binding protein [Xanthomonas massiliensis]|uniref:ATP-binding protein n=1 Tax=Xanthomonas massiliensis TaxID=1720302 RepID=UPI0008244401|nr:ATP-binding protein [Xanthomonas massiliensis]
MNPGVWYGLRDRLRRRADSEHGQAFTRVAMVTTILAYELLSRDHWGAAQRNFDYVVALTVISLCLALALLGWLLWRPQRSDFRRVVGMLADYGLMAMAMSAVGKPMAWIYVVVMWVTIGNGLRYGNRYLMLAVGLSLASFGFTLATNTYWHENLSLGLGLLAGLAAIPLYLSRLLLALTRATEEARRASEAKSRFLANMSHEFRTPLNGLSGMAEVLATTRLDDEQRECLNTIQASTRSLLALVEEVLDISAIEAGKARLNRQDFSLREVLDAVGLILEPQARAHGLAYVANVDADVPDRLFGDADHLRQILLNLAGNGIKFTDRGGVTVQVRTLHSKEGSAIWLRVEIADTGIGIPAAMRDRIFDAFEQGDAGLSRRYQGSGLGTTIAKGLVEALGGNIGLEANVPQGSRFWVELPFEPGTPVSMLAARQAEADKHGANVIAFSDPFLRHRARVRSMHILVADDNEANRMVLERLLQKAGHRVGSMPGGEPVLDALVEGDYDAAIIDLHMPGMSGLDMLRQLKMLQVSGAPQVPVIVLSADVTPESIRRCEQAGARAFLPKPVVASRLLDTLAEVAATQSSARGLVAAPPPAETGGGTDMALDPSVLDELAELGLGAEFEREFIGQCLGDAARCMAALEVAGQQQAWETMREQAHALKGIAGNLGMPRLARHAGELMRLQDWQLRSEWTRRLKDLGSAQEEGQRALARRRGQSDSQGSSVP